jgi:hypothetical protein
MQWPLKRKQGNEKRVVTTGLPLNSAVKNKSPVTVRAFKKSGKEQFKTQCGQ